jgi:CHAT domain-containing protein
MAGVPAQQGDRPMSHANPVRIAAICCFLFSSHSFAAPPAQPALQGDAAKEAERLQAQADAAVKLANYKAAQQAAQALLNLRTRHQGASHWQTVNAQWQMEKFRRLQELPLQDLQAMGTVEGLRAKAALLKRLGKHQEAEKVRREIVAIVEKGLGGEHPETATVWNELAVNLKDQTRYQEAQETYDKVLARRRKSLGQIHPDVASSLNDRAINLHFLGRLPEAEESFRQALDVYLGTVGEEHEDTASCCDNLSQLLVETANYAEAETLCRRALGIRRQLFGEDHLDTAISLNSLGVLLYEVGKHSEAEQLLRRVLTEFRRHFGAEHEHTATAADNLANAVQAQGRYAEAELLFRRLYELRIRLKGSDHVDTAYASNNLANNLSQQGKFWDAAELGAKTLAIRQKQLGERHPLTIASLSNLAVYHDALEEHQKAEGLLRRRLALEQEAAKDSLRAALAMDLLGGVLRTQSKMNEAEAFYRSELDILRRRVSSSHPAVGKACHNLANCLLARGEPAAAADFFHQSLAVRTGYAEDHHPDVINSRRQLSACYLLTGREREALEEARRATGGYEAARLRVSATGLDRAAYGSEHSPLALLAVLQARSGDVRAATTTLERDLARGLLDEVSHQQARELDADRRQTEEELLGSIRLLENQITTLLLEQGDAKARLEGLRARRDAALARLDACLAEQIQKGTAASGPPLEPAQVQAALPPATALLCWIDLPLPQLAGRSCGEHWACLLKPQGAPVWVDLAASRPGSLWTQEDDDLAAEARHQLALVPRPGLDCRPLLRDLSRQRLVPLLPHLPGIRNLVVLPSPALAGVPVEALLAAKGAGEGEFTVTYAPSGTLFARLQQERPQPKGARPESLLALGDPTFRANDEPNKPSERGALQQRSRRSPLLNTRREIEAISRLFKKSLKLQGADASQQRLEELAQADQLRQFDVLHFATHGEMNPRIAFYSALLLADDRLPDSTERLAAGQRPWDGRLLAQDIRQQWRLNAELVTLSACDSARGRLAGGEGYLGFSQALFLAGARSLLVTQWPVEDTASLLLMVYFYENWLGTRGNQPLSKAEALRAAKQWLRTLTHNQAEEALRQLPSLDLPQSPIPEGERPYEHPYYWAAFILIGDP